MEFMAAIGVVTLGLLVFVAVLHACGILKISVSVSK